MDWLDQNLDAYRIVAEMLIQLRDATQARLNEVYGSDWIRDGVPEGVFDRLVASKERERSIDWYESEYQELIDYAVFVDFLEIFEHNAEAFKKIRDLSPNPALLHARFQELEVMRAKLGRARPISETEFAFLSTFQLRLRDALVAQAEEPPPPAPVSPAEDPVPDDVDETPEQPPVSTQVTPPIEAAPSTQVTPPDNAVTPSVEDDGAADSSDDDEAPETLIEVEMEEDVEEEEQVEPRATAPPRRRAHTPGDPHPAGGRPEPAPRPSTIDVAIGEADTREILRELYNEITVTAEALWSEEPLEPSTVWKKVSASTWYEQNFSRLGLKSVSDFYEVISSVHEHMHDGISREEIQDLLKGYNFAQILLSLRDMFQKNNI